MVVVGFAFNQGSFTAIEGHSDGSLGQLRSHTVGPTTRNSYERYFSRAELARFILDLRTVTIDASVEGGWMNGPQPFRSIGSVYNPGTPDAYFTPTYLPAAYDVVIFFESTTASVLLPFYSSRRAPAAKPLLRAAPTPE
jgi:erythromycin esterase-like protein